MQRYDRHVSKSKTPQTECIPGREKDMKQNDAGGFSFALDDWKRLDRFLILGVDGPSYYASERKLTRDNAKAAERCIKADGLRVVKQVVEISKGGRAPKNDPAIFVLAMAAKLGDDETRKAAYESLGEVCRIPTHVAHFAEYIKAFDGGWGKGLRKALNKWYGRPASKIAYQLVKYQSRDGWSNADLIRKAHVKPATPDHAMLFSWAGARYQEEACKVPQLVGDSVSGAPEALRIVWAFEQAKKATKVKEVVKLIEQFGLPHECVPTQFKSDPEIWKALLPEMGLTAMIRNLGNMTRYGTLKSLGKETGFVVDKITNAEELKKARIHPIAVLTAMMAYKNGTNRRGETWQPIGNILDALDKAFYASFKNVEPTGKRHLLALDISGSMDCGEVAGVDGLTPRIASAAMALVTAATEKNYQMIAFTQNTGYYAWSSSDLDGISTVDITPRDRLDTAVEKSALLANRMAGTDCALPMIWAEKHGIEVDAFVVYTDSETWANPEQHPCQALKSYRKRMGIPAKLVVVGMVANEFSIADPSDAGMMDCCGFDTSTPSVISSFVSGGL